ncbi:hypothetical protein F2Q69_00061105 [Brassica cretica]|uniref:Uncharacterized protein n=1 Tax=Brassica cretica TaxID=69181 RepID=A0A8S9RK09_BRACR|nr:hypothetical protein F2Q69_00061105 [Brassica cretica]
MLPSPVSAAVCLSNSPAFSLERKEEPRHGSVPVPVAFLVRFIYRQVKNNCLSISAMGSQKHEAHLQRWFASQA